ncbi:MAG: efflux RND transporter periplasmic adaptor subunit [Kordiimonadaceae bacterium]|nr:efflux RND transporter periplasmic adaptor subunit [Kordiimonadaceae bacterium]
MNKLRLLISNITNDRWKIPFLLMAIFYSTNCIAQEVHEDENERPEISLTSDQIKTAGIKTIKIAEGKIKNTIKATGEVRSNDYNSSIITPRIPSIVIERHARLGDKIEMGETLVTLFSIDMADAQAKFINLSNEWERVKNLGPDIVAAKRYLQSETDFLTVMAQLKSYGMSAEQINLLKQTSALEKPGEYDLYAPQKGTIASDDFLIGSMVEPGTPLFKLIDEDTVWIESAISSSQFEKAFKATRAIISFDNEIGEAQVVVADENVDEDTRRRNIRLIYGNSDHRLHPGQFVDVDFIISSQENGIAVPKDAVLRSEDGDWMLFVQDADGGFIPREVEILSSNNNYHVVSNIRSGEVIVTQGAFFIQSELAKSGFSIHNH